MRIALVHDYLNEFGGAERVLLTLSEMFPAADIYTAFVKPNSTAAQAFVHKKIISSWFQTLPFFWRLYSPLRFLIPWIWDLFDFSNYDLIITSAGWYITKGLGKKFGVPEICYCHTPPRWLYGYPTAVNFQKYWPVKIYAAIVGHFLRVYDFNQAQKVDVFVANSQEVASRIRKFYRRESVVIYPPIPLPNPLLANGTSIARSLGEGTKGRGYYLIISRLVGGKGIELALEAAKRMGFKLKIAGESAGFAKISGVESLGRVSDEEKFELMANAKAFLALAKNEDFGITPVESMMVGTPVIAFNGGGYKETVIHKKTGILFDDYSVEGLIWAMSHFNKLKWDRNAIKKHAQQFYKDIFTKKMTEIVDQYLTPNPSPIIGEGNERGEV